MYISPLNEPLRIKVEGGTIIVNSAQVFASVTVPFHKTKVYRHETWPALSLLEVQINSTDFTFEREQ